MLNPWSPQQDQNPVSMLWIFSPSAYAYGVAASNKVINATVSFPTQGTLLGSASTTDPLADILYSGDSTNGAVVTIGAAGIYSFDFALGLGAGGIIGLSINASALTTGIQALNGNEILAIQTTPAANNPSGCSALHPCKKGDLIRMTASGAAIGSGNVLSLRVLQLRKF